MSDSILTRILIVDDDLGLLRLIEKRLKREDFITSIASSGRQAIAWLAENHADLMLLDLKLQDIEGKELVNRLAATGHSVPFIIITGQGDERVAVEMLKLGALDYLGKDGQFINLVPEVVRHALTELQQKARLAKAEESSRESEARFRLMADHAPVLIWMSGVDKFCTWFNRPWLEFTGRTLEQELGNGWAEGVHPEDLSLCLDVYTKAFDVGEPFVMEYRLRRRDGEWRWIYDQGLPLRNGEGALTGYIGSCIDITDRKCAEEALRKSERCERERAEELAAILHAVPTPVFIARDPDCLHITGNHLADDLLRISRGGEASLTASKEIRPLHYKAMKDGRELSSKELPCQRAARGFPVQNFEFKLVFDDGTTREMLAYATPLRDDAGRPRGAINVLVDLTERKRLERELIEISERERRRFGLDMHDDLGQRLTALEMLSHALAEDLKKQAPALAKQARRLNRGLRETVTQTRLISHSLAPVPLDGDGLMRGLTMLATGVSGIPRVKCHFFCDPPVRIPDVTTATHLYRIAQEAVNNALKHGKARKIDITLTEHAEGVDLSVENNGCAIPAEQPTHSGMGLNVMRYRAEVIGASLSIESGKPKGVRVVCTLREKA